MLEKQDSKNKLSIIVMRNYTYTVYSHTNRHTYIQNIIIYTVYILTVCVDVCMYVCIYMPTTNDFKPQMSNFMNNNIYFFFTCED